MGGKEDVPANSQACKTCKVTLNHSNPLVSWTAETKKGDKFPFQTTVKAAGGILEAERIARLCFQRIAAGDSKDKVLEYRNRLYGQNSKSEEPPSKKHKAK